MQRALLPRLLLGAIAVFALAGLHGRMPAVNSELGPGFIPSAPSMSMAGYPVFISSMGQTTSPSGMPQYISHGISTSVDQIALTAPFAGKFKRLYVATDIPLTPGETYTFTLMIGGAAPLNGPQCSIVGNASTSCEDLDRYADVAHGQRFVVRIVGSPGITPVRLNGHMLMAPTEHYQ